ncbi:MAG: hypothetical protein L0Y38_10495 [Methylococcaceae bacterium]|nr:hypothetical protein [Methylococcaceae bacterium]MCI0734234.1 hypothetical protein [Methylococcaceae bacterium]
MQNLENLIATLHQLSIAIVSDPFASAIVGAALGALIVLFPALFLRRSNKKKNVRLQDEMDRKYRSLQESLSLKTINLATVEQTCQEHKKALANADERIARLEESLKNAPVLEAKIEQQLRQIEALTETIAGELNLDQSPEPCPAASEAAEPLAKAAVIDHLSARLYRQLSTLHQQIADQSQLITELQTELNAKRESVAKQIIIKGQRLPKMAKARFDERVIEPIQMRVDGFRQTVQRFPDQTRAKMDQLLIDPIYNKVNEIKTGLGQIPVQASAQLNKIVLDPLNEFIHSVDRNVKNFSAGSHEKFNRLITTQLEALITQFRMSGRSLSREMLENLNRIIVQPLEKLLAEIKQRLAALPEQGVAKFNEHLVRPAIQKLQGLSESGKQASIDGIRNAGNWVIDTVTRSSAPAAVT